MSQLKVCPNLKYVPIEEPYSGVAINSSIGEGGRRVVQYFHFQEAADINTAAVLHTVSVILSLLPVSVWPRCPHLHIVLTLAHVNISFTVCQSSVQNHVSMLLSTQPQYIHRYY